MEPAEPVRADPAPRVRPEVRSTTGSSHSPVAAHLLHLQRSAGNAAVIRTVQRDAAPKPTGQTTFTQSSDSKSYGGTFDELGAALTAATEAGSVVPTMSRGTQAWTPEGGGPDRVVVADIVIDQKTTLPLWSPQTPSNDPTVAAREQAEWARFAGAIAKHEEGHRAIDVKSMSQAHTAALGKTSAGADAALDAVEAKGKTDNDAYDAANGHGLTGSPSTTLQTNLGQTIKVP